MIADKLTREEQRRAVALEQAVSYAQSTNGTVSPGLVELVDPRLVLDTARQFERYIAFGAPQ